jgi:flagellin-like protein
MPIQDSNHRRMARNRSKEGISPVIATVILIAIAVVIGVAVAAYAGGLFSTQSSTGGINVKTMSLTKSSTALTGKLTIDNQGSRADQIVSIDIPGQDSVQSADIKKSDCSTQDANIPANTANVEKCFTVTSGNLFTNLEPGQTVTVRINLRSGTVLTQSVTVQP